MRKLFLSVLLTLTMILSLTACKKDEKIVEETNNEPEVIEDVTEEEEEVDLHEGMVISRLTGMWIPEELYDVRPVAFMMGNTKSAAPQSGISSAGVVYEIPVEGGITRLMSIIEDYRSLDKIGSSRSCRYYFVHYAMEYNAMYAHFGQSKYAKDLLAKSEVNNINGISDGGSCYYRTSDRKAPHNAYADGEKVFSFAEKKGYATKYDENYEGHFLFASEEEPEYLVSGSIATYVKPGYAVDNPWFEYNMEDGEYYRFQYGDKHIDKETNEQLHCKNIIIQYVGISYMDDNYSLKINTTAGGDGIFITNGKAVNITWSKASDFAVTHYYDETGAEIKLNPGTTWVLLVDKKKTSSVDIH